ncbi:MAG: nitroreductase family protein [Chloroflexota bacterium]
MTENVKNQRAPQADAHEMFTDRWSSRAFSDQELTDYQIAALFEAARWAPSAGNRQPWLFVYATDGEKREQFNSLLSDSNAIWAPKAAMMVLVFAETTNVDGDAIRTGMFDTGAAWMSLALQANRMGLNTRAMGGIDLDAAYDIAGVPRDRYTTMCAVAVGYRGTDDDLHPRMVKNNFANDRKEPSEVAFKGEFSG